MHLASHPPTRAPRTCWSSAASATSSSCVAVGCGASPRAESAGGGDAGPTLPRMADEWRDTATIASTSFIQYLHTGDNVSIQQREHPAT